MGVPTIRKSTLKPTKRGVYIRNLGGKKFNLGKSEPAAYQRRDWIDSVYLQNCQMGFSDIWMDAFFDIARQISLTGMAIVETVSPEEHYKSELGSFPPPDYSYIDRLRQMGIPIEVNGGGQYTSRLPEATVTGTNKPAKTRIKSALHVNGG